MCTRELDGRPVEFGTTGYTMEHVFVLYDRTSDSVWYPLDDRALTAVSGQRSGEEIPILEEPAPLPLGEWLAAHPDSRILLPSEEDLAAIEERRNRPYLGIHPRAGDDCLVLDGLVEDGPAARSGLETGDRLVRLNGRAVDSLDTLRTALEGLLPGDQTEVVVLRAGRRHSLTLTLGRRE